MDRAAEMGSRSKDPFAQKQTSIPVSVLAVEYANVPVRPHDTLLKIKGLSPLERPIDNRLRSAPVLWMNAREITFVSRRKLTRKETEDSAELFRAADRIRLQIPL